MPSLLRSILLPLGLWMAFAPATVAFGHGTPVIVTGQDGRVRLHPSRINAEFEHLGGLVLTDLPGYGIPTSASGISTGAVVQLQVVDQLWFWDPEVRRPNVTSSMLTIETSSGSKAEIDEHTATLPPVELGVYSGAVGWHRHPDYLLDPADSPAGAYGVVLRVLADPLAASEPLLIVFGKYGQGFGPADLEEASADLAEFVLNPLPGDANRDGRVDLSDFIALKSNFGKNAARWAEGDFDRDGKVRLGDFSILKANFGSQRAAAVPEPSALLLTLLGAAVLIGACPTGRRRSSR